MLDASPVILALLRNPLPALRRVCVEETDNSVVLTGTVPSFYFKQLAQEAVLPLLNGRQLLNRLDVIRA